MFPITLFTPLVTHPAHSPYLCRQLLLHLEIHILIGSFYDGVRKTYNQLPKQDFVAWTSYWSREQKVGNHLNDPCDPLNNPLSTCLS